MGSRIATWLYAFLGIALVLASCHKNKSVKPVTATTADRDVYISGAIGDTAVFWKNGKVTHLTDGSHHSMPISLFVTDNNDVYAAGDVDENKPSDNTNLHYVATLWKNGIACYLTDPQSSNSFGEALTVSNGDVYVGGYIHTSNDYATYWKNGVATSVSEAGSRASSIFVDGNNVYLAGQYYTNGNADATYWKNGIATSLGTGTPSTCLSLFVANNDVYTAGYQYTGTRADATYWKNKTFTTLDNGNGVISTVAYSVFVSNGDVYVAGYSLVNVTTCATYWKNGTPVILSNEMSLAQAIYVLGNDVYVAGLTFDPNNFKPIVTCWKNGVATQFPGPGGSLVYSIFVK